MQKDAPAGGRSRLERALFAALVFFAAQSAYLAAYASPSIPYTTMVFVHAFGGVLLLVPFAIWAWQRLVRGTEDARLTRGIGLTGAVLLGISADLAIALMLLGNTRPYRWLLEAHIATAIPATLLLFGYAALRARRAAPSAERRAAIAALALTCLAVPALLGFRLAENDYSFVIKNPASPPLRMEDEGMFGSDGPFHPSSAETTTQGLIPSNFFMTSQTCGQAGCHPDIYAQWQSSMHRHSSFNNQWYRKSIEYMQSVVGVEPSKWCAGCHDLAVLFNGMFDKPVTELIDTPEAQVGLACTACHSITRVKSTMGQGDYVIEYPPLHDLAVSENPALKLAHDLFVRLDPEPHAKTFLKPFHTNQSGEFCSSCHKVHLDKPVNNYRWFRGFNEYDNWQASGVSGMGARSFYYPPQPKDCADCHMPLVPSTDKGARDGKVHSHRFAAANSALPFVNDDQAQLKAVEEFLKKQVTLDIFALANEGPLELVEKSPGAAVEPQIASTFAVGEEGGSLAGQAGRAFLREEPIAITAPIDRAQAAVRRGDSPRVDVVVRTRGVGHFFPGGTVDAFDVWVELKAVDSNGKTIFWSGYVEDEGRGPVEPGAHFYRSLLIDEHGNPINKRNAWAARAVVYVRLIPPGAADTVHFRLRIPEDCGETIHLEAKLNYRKFTHYNTNFAYAGVPDPDQPDARYDKGFDDRRFVFSGDTSKVSGKLKEIPSLPILLVDSTQATLRVLAASEPLPAPRAALDPRDRERWNDYGIGLLLQGDLRAALHAFELVTELEPGYVDGWVNIARVKTQEGDPAATRAALSKAFAIDPKLARAHFFEAMALKAEGDYAAALRHLREAYEQYPKDRVVLNQIARIHFLERDFAAADKWGRKVLEIDPEDVAAHYTLMLSAKGLGQAEQASHHEALYRRFKADEDSQILTGEYRRKHPHDNNERQPIHEHTGIALPAAVEAHAARPSTEVAR